MLGPAALPLQLLLPRQGERTGSQQIETAWDEETGMRDAEPGLGKNIETQSMGGIAKNIKRCLENIFSFKDLTAF